MPPPRAGVFLFANLVKILYTRGMRYTVTLMNSKGKEMPVPASKPQTTLGLAIAYAHKQLDSVSNQKTSALIRELKVDRSNPIVKVVTLDDRYTRSPVKQKEK